MDIDTFLSANKSMVIALQALVKHIPLQNVLLHIEGEASVSLDTYTCRYCFVKEKFRLKNIPSSTYQLETICGFGTEFGQDFILIKMRYRHCLMQAPYFICHRAYDKNTESTTHKKYLAIKYDHLIVDEYQDCTVVNTK